MNLFGVLDVSGSALKAERIRAEVVAANMANAETTRTADGGPYRRQQVIFATASPNGEQSFAASLLGQAGGAGLDGSGVSFAMRGSPDTDDAQDAGVQVAGIATDGDAPLRRYDPQSPDAGPDGYVAYPDINPLTEMVDLMGATRSYGLNTSAIQAEKNMIADSLDIGK